MIHKPLRGLKVNANANQWEETGTEGEKVRCRPLIPKRSI